MAKTKETKPADKSSVNDLYSQVKFLPDKPLTADYEQNDRFGHSGIAEKLTRKALSLSFLVLAKACYMGIIEQWFYIGE